MQEKWSYDPLPHLKTKKVVLKTLKNQESHPKTLNTQQ